VYTKVRTVYKNSSIKRSLSIDLLIFFGAIRAAIVMLPHQMRYQISDPGSETDLAGRRLRFQVLGHFDKCTGEIQAKIPCLNLAQSDPPRGLHQLQLAT
jgi:hypothetical protein